MLFKKNPTFSKKPLDISDKMSDSSTHHNAAWRSPRRGTASSELNNTIMNTIIDKYEAEKEREAEILAAINKKKQELAREFNLDLEHDDIEWVDQDIKDKIFKELGHYIQEVVYGYKSIYQSSDNLGPAMFFTTFEKHVDIIADLVERNKENYTDYYMNDEGDIVIIDPDRIDDYDMSCYTHITDSSKIAEYIAGEELERVSTPDVGYYAWTQQFGDFC